MVQATRTLRSKLPRRMRPFAVLCAIMMLIVEMASINVWWNFNIGTTVYPYDDILNDAGDDDYDVDDADSPFSSDKSSNTNNKSVGNSDADFIVDIQTGTHAELNADANANLSRSRSRGTQGEEHLSPLQIMSREQLANRNRNVPNPPAMTLGAFIHIGKTGGSSLASLLRYGCHSFALKNCRNFKLRSSNETAVSKLTTYYHIPDFNNGTSGLFGKEKGLQHVFYVFTVRDPLDRTISAFLYQHPINVIAERFHVRKTRQRPKYLAALKKFGGSEEAVRRQFEIDFHNVDAGRNGHLENIMLQTKKLNATYMCTPTLEDFAMLLDGDEHERHTSSDSDSECARKVKRAAFSEDSEMHLSKFSMAYIVDNLGGLASLKNKTVLVTRTEFLHHDWKSTNQYLGQDEASIEFPSDKVRDSSRVERPVSATLSDEGRKRICMSLRKEYITYFYLLNQASNLGADDVKNSVAIARKNCPWLNNLF